MHSTADAIGSESDYRIGAEDLLEISVYGVPDLDRTVRVSADGWISLPLVGDIEVTGYTMRELEAKIEGLLQRNYMTNPHVSVFLREVHSHPIAVLGAVEKPGVFQVRGAKSLIEVLSMAQGLAEDAGDSVIVMRHGGLISPAAVGSPDPQPAAATDLPRESAKQGPFPLSTTAGFQAGSVDIKLKELLGSGDARYNVMVYPGDVVKVPRAGIVYVVGEVKKPGGFVLKTNENISVLQALALAEGLTHTSAAKHARIIRTDEATGERNEIPIDLGRILAGKVADPVLRPNDIVFVPDSASKTALYRGAEAALSIAGGVIVYPFKILGGFGDGGAITTNDPDVVRMVRRLRYNGEDRETGEYHYHGATALLDNVQAAVLNVKLSHLPKWIEHRRGIAALYREGLRGILNLRLPHFDESNQLDIFQNYVIRTDARDRLRQHLANDGVETLIHWPKPMWRHEGLGLQNPGLAETEEICKEVISLPMSAETTPEHVEIVVDSVRSFYAPMRHRAAAVGQLP
ncbi:MAG: DegT/DnrJ/EryC1/StrS family aminotransferase [Candidatus Acidiferrales bacterium]